MADWVNAFGTFGVWLWDKYSDDLIAGLKSIGKEYRRNS